MEWISKKISKQRAARRMRTSPYRVPLSDLPPLLESNWRQSAPREYRGISTDAFFFACAAEGLMIFFDAATSSGVPCALPSEAADSVWHAWLRHDPIGLERFCRKHFGKVVPHLEWAGLARGALATALVACRRLEGKAPEGPDLPRLFALDSQLRMPNGHGYWVRAGEIVYIRLGERGRGRIWARQHPELTMQALFMAGLIDAHVLASHRRALVHQTADDGMGRTFLENDFAFAGGDSCDGNGSDGGGGCDGGGDGGGTSCDGGSNCGSSCGSSCGGGGND